MKFLLTTDFGEWHVWDKGRLRLYCLLFHTELTPEAEVCCIFCVINTTTNNEVQQTLLHYSVAIRGRSGTSSLNQTFLLWWWLFLSQQPTAAVPHTLLCQFPFHSRTIKIMGKKWSGLPPEATAPNTLDTFVSIIKGRAIQYNAEPPPHPNYTQTVTVVTWWF